MDSSRHAIGIRRLSDNFIWFLDAYVPNLTIAVKQADIWFGIVNTHQKDEWQIFVVPTHIVEGKLHLSNEVHLNIYRKYTVYSYPEVHTESLSQDTPL